jgi:hypothetical protein
MKKKIGCLCAGIAIGGEFVYLLRHHLAESNDLLVGIVLTIAIISALGLIFTDNE